MELDRLAQIVAKVLSVDPREVTLTTTFMEDLGADSLDIFQIIAEIENECNITLTEEQVSSIHTVEEALFLIEESRRNI